MGRGPKVGEWGLNAWLGLYQVEKAQDQDCAICKDPRKKVSLLAGGGGGGGILALLP